MAEREICISIIMVLAGFLLAINLLPEKFWNKFHPLAYPAVHIFVAFIMLFFTEGL